jgi:hypothetical protein
VLASLTDSELKELLVLAFDEADDCLFELVTKELEKRRPEIDYEDWAEAQETEQGIG